MSFITTIGTAVPKNVFNQTELADFMVKVMRLNEDESKKLRTIFRASGIATRASVIEDYGKQKDFTFYSNSSNFEPFPSTKKRNEVYRQNAIVLSLEAIENAFSRLESFDSNTITHLITVSCTGFYAPGLDIDLINHLNLPTDTHRTCINFMGCYAAITALKAADSFCKADPMAKVLIVATELCSLHFQKAATDDNYLANALFSDGAAAVLMESETTQKRKISPQLFKSKLIPNNSNHMAWDLGDFGFEMKLSAYVPDIIEKNLTEFCSALFSDQEKSIQSIQYIAIHPGGKKILTASERALSFSKEKNAHAYHVLKKFGNMSSPTILFVIKEIFDGLSTEDTGEEILSFAFGPGLTLEMVLFKIEVNT